MYLNISDSVYYDENKKKITIHTSGCGCCSDTEEHNVSAFTEEAIYEYIKDIQGMLNTAQTILDDRKKVANAG